MNLIEQFKEYLLSQKQVPSKATVKNYKADIGQFIRWYEARFSKAFEPTAVTPQVIELYKSEKIHTDDKQIHTDPIRENPSTNPCLSVRSIERHMSSLRKFFQFLKLESIIGVNPFEEAQKMAQTNKSAEDPYRLRDFKSFLYVYNASHLTIKNYLIDVKQFLKWAEEVTAIKDAWNVNDKNLFNWIDSGVVEEYKQRLIESGFAPLSINRKLSSLRRYLGWAGAEGLIKSGIHTESIHTDLKADSHGLASQVFPLQAQIDQNDAHTGGQTQTKNQTGLYSRIPPFRMAQKVSKGVNFLFDSAMIAPLAKVVGEVRYGWWKLRGSPVFEKRFTQIGKQIHTDPIRENPFTNPRISNLKKVSFAPLTISTRYFPWYRKLFHHARHTRPNWYRQYHQNPIVHYFHFAILIIFMSALGFGLYQNFIAEPKAKSGVLAAAVSPLKILSFQGRLTDASDNPITASKLMRFTIYSDLSASAGARLWEEVERVNPDTDGIFSILLGSDGAGGNAALCNGGSPPSSPATGACGIPQSLFAQNAALYLGVTVQSDSELTPRQQLATVAYATNAEVLQGMPPITDSGVTTNTNAVLALNSSGQVAIGGTAVTTFQSANGQLTLTGKTLALNTAAGTGTNIQIAPDGLGIIDLQKPIQNTSNNNNIGTAVGSVEVDDLLSVLASSSGQSAFTINQTSTGPLISASASGVAKFTVDNSGNGYYAGNVGIGYTNYGTAVLAVNGNVGIGTTSPTEKLDVNGNIKISSTNWIGASSDYSLKFDRSSSYFTSLNSNGTMYLNIDSGNNDADTQRFVIAKNAADNLGTALLTVLETGNVGLGTTNPSSFTLEVAGNVGPEATGTRDLGSSSRYWNNVYANNIISPSSGTSGYWQRNSGAVSPTNITDDLLVGGISTAAAKFSVVSSTGTASSSGSFVASTIKAPTGALNLQYKSGANAWTNALTILDNSGNIGIGNTNPSAPFNVASANATGNIGLFTGNSLTTGNLLSLSSTSTVLSSGGLASLDWSPSGSTTIYATGDLLSINAGQYASIGNLLNIKDNGSSVFSVSQTGVTSNLPTSFTSPGDVSMAYDLLFTNPTASYIKSAAPLYLEAGESFGSSDLSLRTFGKGNVIVDSEAFVTNYAATVSGQLVVGTSTPTSAGIGGMYLTNSATYGKALAILNQTESQDIFTASASGVTKFTIAIDGSASMAGTLAVNTIKPLTGALNLQYKSGANAWTNGLTLLDNSGNVGIGTTNPLANLYIKTAAGAANLTIDGAGTAAWTNYSIAGVGKYSTGWNNSGYLDFYESGVGSRMVINGGNVGINTTTPRQLLDVLGKAGATQLRLSSTDNSVYSDIKTDQMGYLSFAPSGLIATFSATLNPNATSTYDLGSTTRYWNNVYANNIISPSSGTSGYWQRNTGAVSPTNITDDLLIGGISTSAAKFSVVSSTGNASSSGTLTVATIRPPTGALNLQYKSGANAWSNALTILDNSGNIGIGTTAPGALLHVQATAVASTPETIAKFTISDSAAEYISLSNNTSTDGRFDPMFKGYTDRAGGYPLLFMGSVLAAQDSGAIPLVNFQARKDSGAVVATRPLFDFANFGTSVMRILANGNIGIGTTGPGAKLDVAGTVKSTGLVSYASGGTAISVDGSDVHFDSPGVGNAFYWKGASTGTLSLTQHSTDPLLTLTGTGNLVGIGTTLPRQLLDVLGKAGATQLRLSSTDNSVYSDIKTDQLGYLSFAPSGLIATFSATLNPNATSTYDLGSTTRYWNNVYANNIISPSSGTSGYWQRNLGAVFPTNITDDLLIGGISTAAAKFSIVSSTGTASSSGSFVASTFKAPTGALNLQYKSGADAWSNALTVLDNSGNVGIGTTGPGEKLEVSGNIKLTNVGNYIRTYANDLQNIIYSTRTDNSFPGYLKSNGWAGFSFSNGLGVGGYDPGTTSNLVVNGNVGIGTTLPLAKLDISGSASVSANMNLAGAGTAHTFNILDNGTLNFVRSPGGDVGATMANSMLFLNNNGNIGIGTTGPSQALDVGSGYIVTMGRVGIGTTSPLVPLQIAGTAEFITGNGTLSKLRLTQTGQNNWDLAIPASTSRFDIQEAGTPRLTILSQGNVGIGTTLPRQLLDVLGKGGTTQLRLSSTDNSVYSDIKTDQMGYLSFAPSGLIATFSATINPNATSTYDLGSTTRYWNNVYANNIISPSSGTSGYWQRNLGAVFPTNITDDLLIGGISTAAAKFSIVSSTGTASSSGSFVASTFKAPTGALNLQYKSGANAWTNALTVLDNSGNIGIGTTAPTGQLHIETAGILTQKYVAGASSAINLQFGDTADDNIGIISYNNNGDYMYFRTNNSEQVRINSSGNVGIGITSPSTKLAVNGNALIGYAEGTAGGPASGLAVSGSVGIGTTSPSQALDVGSGYIVTLGRIGVGTTSPSYPLDIQSSGGVTEQLKATTSTNSISSVWDNTNGTLRIGVESSTGGTIIAGSSLYSGVISMASTRSLHFGTTSVVRMTIDSSGNVGIGTTAPLSPLHISGGNTGGRAVLIVDQIGSSNNDILTASASGVTKFYVTNAGNVVASQFIDLDNTIYYLDPASTGTSLATRGNIGIGTTNPLSALDVTGTASISANLSLDGAATAHTFNILDNGTLDFRRSPSGDVGATAANSVLFLNNNGNIGIGTTGPGAKLDLYSTTTSGTDFRIANNGITTGTVASISADLMNSGTLLNLRANSLNTGTMLSLNSTSTGLTTGGLASLDWSPTGTTTIYATGDLLSINAGQYASVGNLLNLKDNGSSVFSVSQTAITANLPASFTSAGDVSMAYDLLFTNPTASYIKSAAPLYLEAGESFGSSDLSLRTFGKGNVIIDSEAFVTNYAATVSGQLVVGTATPTSAGIGGMYLTNSATYGKALAIFNQTESQDIFTASSSGTPRFVIQNGGNVGIGTSAPSSLLSVGGTSQFQVNSTGAIAAATGITSSGTITFSNFNANNKVLYATVSTGVLNGPSTDTQNLCLVSGASAPTWGPCNTGVTTDLYWNQSSGVLFPNNSTVDFAIGGQSTSAAKFAFINMNSGTPTASISGNLALAVPSGNAPASTISLLNNGTLNFLRSPGGDVGATMANSILFLNNNGNVGIGITAPNNRLEVLSTTEPQVRFSYDASNYTTFDVNNVGAMTMIAYGSGATPINIQANGTTGGSDISLNTDYAWYYKNRNGTLDSTLFTQGELSVGLAGAASFSQVANIPFTVYDMSAGYATTNRAAFIEKTGNMYLKGNLGIGTSSPLAGLDITGSASLSANFNLRGAATAHTFNILDNGTLNFVRSPGGDAGATMANSIMFLNNNGKIGIGTTNPSDVLDINGNMRLRALANSQDIFVIKPFTDTGTSGFFQRMQTVAGADVFAFDTNGTFTMGGTLTTTQTTFNLANATATTINFGGAAATLNMGAGTGTATINNAISYIVGNLGVKNSNPLTALDVTGSASLSANLSLRGAATAHTFNILDNGTLNFVRSPGGDAGLATALFIQNNGNIGIGTTGPASLLTVGSSSLDSSTVTDANLYALLRSTSDTNGQGVGLGFQNSSGATVPGAAIVFLRTGSNGIGDLAFYTKSVTDNTTAPSERLRILSGGNVGIGTTAPIGKLHVDGTNIGKALAIFNETGTNDILTASASGVTKFYLTNSGNVVASQFVDLDNTIYYLDPASAGISLATKGNIGIGTTTPRANLDIVGSASVSANMNLAGATTAHTFNILDNGTLNFVRSPGGDAGATMANSMLFLNNNGNVGIGTTAPGGNLEVSGAGFDNNGTIYTKQGNLIISGTGNRTAGLGGQLSFVASDKTGSSTTTTLAASINGFAENSTDSNAAGALAFHTTYWNGSAWVNTEKMRITSGGNVGIGTTAPGTYKLNVAGTGYFMSSLDVGDRIRITGGSGGYFYNADSTNITKAMFNSAGDWLGLQTDASNVFSFADKAAEDNSLATPVLSFKLAGGGTGGNVGIGTTNPDYALDVNGQIGAQNQLTIAGSWAQVQAGTANIDLNLKTIAGTGGIMFITNNTNQGYLDSTGRLGIGTTNPGYKLTVNDNSTTYATVFLQNNADGWGSYIWVNNADTDKDAFHIDNSSGGIFVVRNGGNVGIGTTAPSEVLSVSGNATISGTLAVNTIKPPTGALNLQYKSGANAWTNGITLLDNSGNVGIGTTGPSAKLEVAGEILGQFATGTNLIAYDNAGRTTTATTYTKVEEMQLGWGGSLTVKFNLDGSCSGFNCAGTAYGRLYKNGSAVGTERTATIATNDGTCNYTTYSENLTGLVSGDLIQVYGKVVNTSGTNTSCVDDFQLYANYAPTAKVTSTNTDTGDIAENYITPQEELIGSGDIVSIDKSSTGETPILSKSKTAYDTKMAGIVSTNPAITLDEKTGENGGLPIALVGRIPVKVVLEGGKIKAGDPITSSSIPGVGMKAEQAGSIIGKALEGWDNSDENKIVGYFNKDSNKFIYEQGDLPADYSPLTYPNILPIAKIMVFADLGWYDPGPVIADTGELKIVSSMENEAKSSSSGILNTKYLIQNTAGQIVQRVGAFAEIAVANVRAGLIQAQEISTDSLKIATDNVSIGGVTLKDYITQTVSTLLASKGQAFQGYDGKIISPIAEVDQIHAGVISPLAQNPDLIIRLAADTATHSSQLVIQNASGSAVATIDSSGNASFAGQLSSNSLTSNDATISGTLRAKNIIADSIEGLNARIATIAAGYIKPLAQSNNSTIEQSASSSSTLNSSFIIPNSGQINIASFSSQLAYVQNLTSDNAVFNQGLMVFGPTSLSDISVTGQLSVGGNMILSDGAINVLGSSLELQPLKQGALSIMGGLVYIDTDGNMRVGGNAEFAKDVTVRGRLMANIISPIPDSDLVIKLGNQEQNHNSSFVIHNSSDSAVLSINQLGDVIASGAGSFAKLNLNPISQAIALSDHEVIATGSAGVATISAHLTELTIRNNLVTEKSLIYITPVGNTNNQVLYLLRQIPDVSFTVGISQPVLKEIPFNWMLVN